VVPTEMTDESVLFVVPEGSQFSGEFFYYDAVDNESAPSRFGPETAPTDTEPTGPQTPGEVTTEFNRFV
jgi:hypothetical protein